MRKSCKLLKRASIPNVSNAFGSACRGEPLPVRTDGQNVQFARMFEMSKLFPGCNVPDARRPFVAGRHKPFSVPADCDLTRRLS